MNKVIAQHRVLSWVFGVLTLLALGLGGYAMSQQSDMTIILALVPLFGVLALAFGISARHKQ